MEHYTEEIIVCNEAVFNDSKTHTIEMDFFDGYAISVDKQYGMSFPTLEEVERTEWMQEEILKYCGDNRDGTEYPFDIALKYGVLFKLPQDSKVERRVEWLERFALDGIGEDGKAEYKKFCEELDAPSREYFVLYHDRTDNGGMGIKYLGKLLCKKEALEKAFDTLAIPNNAFNYTNPTRLEEAAQVVAYGTGIEVHAVYRSSDRDSNEYWTVVSAPSLNRKFCALIWNRNNCSAHVNTGFELFETIDDMQKFMERARIKEMQHDLANLGITWNVKELHGDCGLLPVSDHMIKNLNIESSDWYNVWVVGGRYK